MHIDLGLCDDEFYLSNGMYFAFQASGNFDKAGVDKSFQQPNMPFGIITGQLKNQDIIDVY